ncbi:MAG: hypothetical protein ABJC19_01905 [Gemmatimonadota bacterium]
MRLMGWKATTVLGLTGCLSGVGPGGITVVPLPGTATMHVGDRVQLKNTGWTLTFNAVTSDSRCPVDAVCIQAGEAVLDLTLENLLSAQPRIPAYQVTLKGEKPDTVAGLILRQVQLDPPKRTNTTITPRDYVAKISIRQQYLAL